MKEGNLKVGSVVQIDPEHSKVFGGCFMVVTEVKSWGAIGVINVPGTDIEVESPSVACYFRCEFKHMKYVGTAQWMPKTFIEEPEEEVT